MAAVPPENVDSSLEEVRRRLFANAPKSDAAPTAAPPPTSTSQGWKPEAPTKRVLSVTAWFFVVAVGFFFVAAIAAALILFLGGRSVGNDRISIQFEGPVTVDGGKETIFDLIIENGNPVAASSLQLSIDFPEGAFAAETLEPLGHYSAELSDLAPGESERHSIKVVYFGAENQKISVPVSLEYRTPNSSATFIKEATRDMTIATAPLSVRVTATPEISSGQRFTVSAVVRSNAPAPLTNVALKAYYPFGFNFVSADTESIGANVFPVGDLAPGEEAEIKITGTLTGEDGEERVFRFEGGVLPDPEAVALRTPAYTVADTGVTITRSFLAVTMTLNQANGDVVVQGGESVQGSITWLNTLAQTITDGKLEIVLSGELFDYASVDVANGFYRSSDHTIVFDKGTEPGLQSLSPDESGAGAFRFSIKNDSALQNARGATGKLTVSVSGRRVGEGGREDQLSSTVTRTVRLASHLALDASIVHGVGSFENSGPIPPRANQETTYTVRWDVENSVNTVANVRVAATLPSYVEFTGVADPSGDITFNESTREVSWSIGEMSPDTSRDGAFQISFTPSSSQTNTTPDLLTNLRVMGFDRFVQEDITTELPPLNTEITEDPGFQSGDGRVE